MNRNCEGLQQSFATASLNKVVEKLQIPVPIQGELGGFYVMQST